MRIGYLTSQYPAASHTFIRREVEALRSQGVMIDTFSVRPPAATEIVSSSDASAFASTFYILPMSIVRLAATHLRAACFHPMRYARTLRLAISHRAHGGKALIWAGFHFAESIVLARELERRRIGHLHNHFANAGATVGLLATRFLGISWSLTLHGISETDYPAGLLLGRKIAAANFVACASWFGRAQAMRLSSPEQWARLRVVRCGVQLPAIDAVAPALRAPSKTRQIICVARLSPEKGHLGLLEAFAGLRSQGIAAELVFVGDGPERRQIEQGVATLGLQGTVHFLGRLNEARTLEEIAASDLLVLPSFMEGLPVVLMEAMALGVPVISSRVAGTPELIQDEEEGLLFRPSDWADLSVKMARMLSGDDSLKRFVLAARAKIEAEFDIEHAVSPLREHFAMLSAEDTGAPQEGLSDRG